MANGRSAGSSDRPPDDRDPVVLGPVLHVVTSSARRGAEVFGYELCLALAAMGTPGRTVALVPGGEDAQLPVPTLGRRTLALSTLGGLRRAARVAPAMVAHGSDTLVAASLSTLGLGTPFVYRTIGDPRYWSATPARSRWVRSHLRRAAAVVALWQGAADQLADRYGVGVDRLRVIPNGVRAEAFPAVTGVARAAAREHLGVPGAGPIVCYLGALSPEKGVDVAIRAIPRVPGATLLVAGAGPERPSLEALASRYAAGRVRFLGPVAQPAAVLAAADVVVLPSRTEGLPAAAIEAGMSGLAVVATDVGGTSEVVVDGETGRLVVTEDPGALASGIADALRHADRFGRAARERCRARFDLTSCIAPAWAELIGSLARRARSTR
ncbi:MAG: glycosyltransferase family 4 protein [Anaerolineales bacterium]